MKLMLIVLTLVCFSGHPAHSQENPDKLPEFGKVAITELQMKDCGFSPGAEAINLFKSVEVELSVFPNGNTEVVTISRYRTKIFNKRGYKNATVIIPLYGDNSIKTKNIQAATYNLSANNQVRVSTVKEEDIFKSIESKKDDAKSIKFTFPDIEEGSVIEYQILQKFKMAYDAPSWYFQDDIPNALSIYKIFRPTTASMRKRVISPFPLEETHVVDESQGPDKKRMLDTYILKNIPAFKTEPFMSSPYDYRSRIEFLMGGAGFLFDPWLSANSRLLRSSYFGGTFTTNIPGTKAFVDSAKHLQSVQEKISAVYSFVKQNLRWNHVHYIFARDLAEVWKQREGTSAEINLCILNLLRKCDVQSFPVLYSTRRNGKVDYDFPDIRQFNTVNIAVVNGKKFNLLDGTNPYLSYETPPFNVVNRTGLLIDPDYQTKIDIDFDRKLVWDSISVTASIDAKGLLKGSCQKKYFDLAKSMKLEKMEEKDDDSKGMATTEKDFKTDSTWQLNANDPLQPLVVNSTYHYDLPATGKFLFFDPFLFSELSKNPFIDSSRISEIDFGASSASIVQIKISLAKNIRIEELPKDREICTADSSICFMYHNEFKNDTIYISSSIEIKKPIFDKTEYSAVRSGFEKFYSLLNNRILLQRKDEK